MPAPQREPVVISSNGEAIAELISKCFERGERAKCGTRTQGHLPCPEFSLGWQCYRHGDGRARTNLHRSGRQTPKERPITQSI